MKIGAWDSVNGYVLIIAEIGCNHEGNPSLAKDLVKQAAKAGADAVKFQVYNADTLVDSSMPALTHAGSHKTQLERMRSLQLSHDDYRSLAKLANRLGMMWMASAFDEESVDLVAELAPCIKIASGEFTNHDLIRYALGKDLPLIVSSGMTGENELAEFRSEFKQHEDQIALLHCVSLYPANYWDLALRRCTYPGWMGYSDHSMGIEACVAAAAMGAMIIEKHFTALPKADRRLAPGDHIHSVNRTELATMIKRIHDIEFMRRNWSGERPDIKNRKLLRRHPVTGLRGS